MMLKEASVFDVYGNGIESLVELANKVNTNKRCRSVKNGSATSAKLNGLGPKRRNGFAALTRNE